MDALSAVPNPTREGTRRQPSPNGAEARPHHAIARVDAHQHFWLPSRGDYDWLRADDESLRPLQRSFLPVDLHGLLRRHDVGQTVLVQAAPTDAETGFMLELADAHAWIAGVVGWVDLADAGAAAKIAALARHPKFKGVRPMLQDLPQADWICSAPQPAAIDALLAHGLRFDALVRTEHLAALRAFADRHPALPIVIDHAAKPNLAAGWNAAWAAEWRRELAALAERPQLMCKFSGLLTELAAHQRASSAHLLEAVRPVWDELLQRFGPDRIVWGSDWPVLTLAADYEGWIAVCTALADELNPAQRERFWCGNARSFYGLAADPNPHLTHRDLP